MPQFSDSQISKWCNDYERTVCATNDLLVDRVSLAITTGYNEYELPNYVTNIRQILYKGKEVYPKGYRSSIIIGDTPFQTVGSAPFEYLYSGKGLRVIKFFPTPNEDVALYTSDLWTIAADEAAVIIEFYRTPVFSDYFMRLPEWVRRYILKDYVCWKAFVSEGPQQDLRAAKYYESRMVVNEEYIKSIRGNLYQGYVNILASDKLLTRKKPARPVLPSNFGIPCRY